MKLFHTWPRKGEMNDNCYFQLNYITFYCYVINHTNLKADSRTHLLTYNSVDQESRTV